MATAVPSAVTNLLTLIRAVVSADTTVELSLPLPRYQSPVTVRITGVAEDSEWREIGPDYRREEFFNIQMEVASYAGDDDWEARMTEAFAVYDLITVAVANDSQLTGVPNGTGHAGAVRLSEPKNMNFYPEASPDGKSLGRITFDIACKARVDSLD